MQIVIDIPEETYEYWKEHSHEYVLSEAIKNGIPLPEGHGDLIYKDDAIKALKATGLEEVFRSVGLYPWNVVAMVEPVVEADGGDE